MASFKGWLDKGDIFGFSDRVIKNPNQQTPSLNQLSSQEYFKKHKDIFGFDRLSKLKEPDISLSNLPVKPISTYKIIKNLEKRKLGALSSQEIWPSSIIWGKKDKDNYYDGAIELDLSPFGSVKAFINRKITDLKGKEAWICIQAIPLTEFEDYDSDVEDKITDILWENLQKAVEEKPLLPKKEYDIQPLVKEMYYYFQKEMPVWFIFENMVKLPDTDETKGNYIIYYSCRGQGAGMLWTGGYLIQFNIQITYFYKKGIIKVIGYDITGEIQNKSWKLNSPEFEMYFSPEQDIKNKKYNSILHCVAHALRAY